MKVVGGGCFSSTFILMRKSHLRGAPDQLLIRDRILALLSCCRTVTPVARSYYLEMKRHGKEAYKNKVSLMDPLVGV
ncbi:hypothetical protein PsorP6_001487 [Peronosclerospora sorghi]|uniref:Uncharacterized protein n=1 Tax=Peronosclerospora sorghi TaxID=230839 RepID=A0ACC0WV20_9STRA|nr:hypothetical protein PsorP6_001487 [Peronosclerospora sorghi]